MGAIYSTLNNSICTCVSQEEQKEIETNYITPKAIQPDIKPDTSNLDYTTDNLYDTRHLKYSTLNDHEYNTHIKYYILMNGKRIDMI